VAGFEVTGDMERLKRQLLESKNEEALKPKMSQLLARAFHARRAGQGPNEGASERSGRLSTSAADRI
jgi:hypothetical protein